MAGTVTGAVARLPCRSVLEHSVHVRYGGVYGS